MSKWGMAIASVGMYILIMMHPAPLYAQTPTHPRFAAWTCYPRDTTTRILWEKYKETVSFAGVAITGYLLEIWTNDETGSWTVTLTTPTKLTCILQYGQAWTPRRSVEPGTKVENLNE